MEKKRRADTRRFAMAMYTRVVYRKRSRFLVFFPHFSSYVSSHNNKNMGNRCTEEEKKNREMKKIHNFFSHAAASLQIPN
jgi:hypothetical protein